MRYRVVNTSNGLIVAERAERASTFAARFLGLMGRPSLAVGDGLHLEPCSSIHMFFMRFAIDAIFLDRRSRVVEVVHTLAPWRTTRIYRQARSVLEVPAGTATATATAAGQLLRFEPSHRL